MPPPPTGPWTMPELLAELERWLALAVPEGQTRDTVSEVPDARTIRYYVSQGLVDRPSGKRGTRALYGPRHLLQVLAVKRLQAEHLPIRKIRQLLAGEDDAALAARLALPEAEDLVAGKGLDARRDEDPHEATGPPPTEPSRDPRRAVTLGARRPPGASPDPTPWDRYPLADGVELHLRAGLRLDPKTRRRVLAALDEILTPHPPAE